MIKPPCYQCQDRKMSCHGSCEKYAEFAERNSRLRENSHKNKEYAVYHSEKVKRIFK